MSAYDTLIFRDWDGVTGKPNVNGFVTDDAGVFTFEPQESGYVNGSRMTFGDGGPLPPVIAQCVKDGNDLVFGFFCRGDKSFDDHDALVLALRPNTAGGAARRIDIFPVWGDGNDPMQVGFGAAEPNLAFPGQHENTPTVPPGGPVDYKIRTKIHAHAVNFYRPDASALDPSDPTLWEQYTPANAPIPPDNDVSDADPGTSYRVRVRSWEPNTAPFEAAWSIEIRLPIGTVTGGGDWIDLNAAGFGFYFNLIRAGRLAASGGDADYHCVQFRFPNFPAAGSPIDSRITGELDVTARVRSNWYGTGLINPPASAGEGVRFKGGVSGVGRRDPGNTTMIPSGTIMAKSGNNANDMVAILENTGPQAADVKAIFRIGKYGLNGWGSWTIPSGMGVATKVTIPSGTPGAPSAEKVSVSSFVVPSGDWPDYVANSHRCMWVDLTSDSNVLFTQSSVRRNMDFITLSDYSTTAEVSGVGYPEPASGNHDFLLFSRCRTISVQDFLRHYRENRFDPDTLALVAGALQHAQDGQTPGMVGHAALDHLRATTPTDYSNVVVYLWVTEGYRRTGGYLVHDKIKMEVLDEVPGAFAMVANHVGLEDNFSWSLEAPGLSNYGKGVHALKVPHKGAVTLGFTLSASPQGPKGDISKDPPASGGHGVDPDPVPKGCLAFLTTLFNKSS